MTEDWPKPMKWSGSVSDATLELVQYARKIMPWYFEWLGREQKGEQRFLLIRVHPGFRG